MSLTALCMTDSYHRSAGGISNRSNYQALTGRMNIVERCRIDSICHFVHQAMLCYSQGKYNKALRIVQQCKEKISAPESMCRCKMTLEWYRETGGDYLPIETMLKRHFIGTIRIGKGSVFPELYIESHERVGEHVIPPLVCAYFLQYLCHRKLGCPREASEASYELSLFLQHVYGKSTCTCRRGPSWQILGICQQMSGNDEAAFNSYVRALQQGVNYLPKSTCIRLGTLLAKYFWPFVYQFDSVEWYLIILTRMGLSYRTNMPCNQFKLSFYPNHCSITWTYGESECEH